MRLPIDLGIVPVNLLELKYLHQVEQRPRDAVQTQMQF